MFNKLKVSSLALAIVVPLVALTVGVSGASAETTDEVNQTIIESSLSNVGVTITDETLLAELRDNVGIAINDGLIDPSIVDDAISIVESDPSATETPAPDQAERAASLDKLIDDNITEQGAIWDQAEPSWNAAFDTIRAAFEECRSTDGQTTSRCARTLGFQLQVAHAESVLADLDARIAVGADLPGEEQEAALAELEAERVALLARLDRASAKLVASTSESTPGADASTQARLNAVARQLRSRGAVDPEVAISDQQTPETGSVAVEQSPGNSGQNVPANPRSNGNVSENPANSGNQENSGNNKR